MRNGQLNTVGKKTVSLIVATDRTGIIAKNGEIPWHCSGDFRYFREKTLGKPVIMGKTTYDTIGFPLKGRNIIVLDSDYTSNRNLCYHGSEPFHVFRTVDEALKFADMLPGDEIMIAGGRSVYEHFIKSRIADKIFLNIIHADVKYEDRDNIMYFPFFNAVAYGLIDWKTIDYDEKRKDYIRWYCDESEGHDEFDSMIFYPDRVTE